MRNPANPTDSAREVAGSSNHSGAGESARADSEGRSGSAGSPWEHGAGATHTDLLEASATTASLPAIGGAKDPYAQQDAVTAVHSGPAPAGAPAGAFPAPVARRPAVPAPAARPSAVDQYAAMAGAGAAGAAASRAGGSAARNSTASAAGGVGSAPKVRPAKAIRSPKSSARTPRRAKLQLRHLNVWSVLRFSCVLAIALFFVWLIMVGVLYGVLDVTHVFDKVNDTVRQINGDNNAKNVVTPGIIFAGAFIIGLVNIVLFIALSTIGSIVYNLCADLVGGIEVTFAEHE